MKLETFFEKFDQFADAPDAVAKMRELVLRLAFSGGLTGERPTDDGLPDGWERRTIESISASISSGFACSRSYQVENGHVHLRTHNISTLGTLNFDLLVRIDPKMVDPQKASIRAGDILFNNTNSQELVGKTSLVDRDYDYGFSNHITRIRLKDRICPGFVVFYLTLLRNSGYFARLCTRWINQAAVNTDTLKEQTIPLPPLAEQKRIVAKVDELMALCDRLEAQQQERETRHAALARASLARFADAPTPANLPFLFHPSYAIPPADLRKSILTLAVQGKLVPQDPNDEPAEEIVSRVAAERPDTAEAPVDDAELPWSLPSCWQWVRLGAIANIKHGYAFSSESFTTEPTRYVLTTPGNFYESGGFRDRGANTKYFRGEVPPAFVLKARDLIIPMTEQAAGLLGSPAFIPDDGKTYLHNQRLGKIEFYSDEVSPEFVFCFFNSEFFRGELARTCTGMKVRHTSPKRILKVPFALPPLAEQRRIVAKVEQLMALVDALETQLAEAKTRSTALLDAVIHELLNPTAEIIDLARYRAAIGCYSILKMAGKPYFGRTAAMKILYLAETHLGLELGGNYQREAAGPFDPWIYRFEEQCARENVFKAVDSIAADGWKKIGYLPGPALETQARLIDAVLAADQRKELDRLFKILSGRPTEEVEIIATLFAAWNDLLIDGHTPCDDDIVREVRERWHQKKERFTSTRLHRWLGWLRDNLLIPQGNLPRTVHQTQFLLN